MQLVNKKIHFVGIKGIGLSTVAQFCFRAGAKVTGSDNQENFPADSVLNRLKIPCHSFSSKNITSQLDLVVYSSAYNQNHPEIKKAVRLKIPLKSYGEILAEIFNQGKHKIVVAGSHGKTTTTALLGHLLDKVGCQPTVFVGGLSNNWQNNFKKGKNEWLVAEGDEYQKKFLFLKPDYLLITNIDFDHPDCFKDKKEYRQAFEALKKQTKKKIFSGQKISPVFKKFLETMDFPLLGEKNKENAYLVYRLAKELKIPDKKIKTAFETFKGVKRRMEFYLNHKLSVPSSIIVDDYAHHPEEIKATLSALKEKYPDYKLLAIFQPHTFSRTKSLMADFGKCFQKADFVYLLPTFASARESGSRNSTLLRNKSLTNGQGGRVFTTREQKPKENMDKLLLKEVKKHHPKAKFLPSFKNFKLMTSDVINLKLIILTLGAGDVYKLAEGLAKKTPGNLS
ncbi:hypothetical protein A3G50_01165 [Candidatus Jorgensenbacteria bacterium RIFCSPLOWO2_12_FULL_42_11]|uniref:UDP-N-acetylmuramate--L-alanine ligase n=1 Tax=Candidatus Jorgensenbacteria bacterium RIFCSPLOWO2_12_FULL_42_11 TaxID=1798473 RepID=A0A1F6C210_9BACT|nr:MAG: hypothetical protein A3G50_01165 [Candidatus Jorgensenbacteria bacterium RIFCSPLOWO2_12_FULL_42_11]